MTTNRRARWQSLRESAAPLATGLFVRVLLPFYGHGFRWDDEHWQVIEPAGRLLGRAWSTTTEWSEGLRSWIYPWLVSLPMRAAGAAGVDDPLWLNAAARMAHGLVAALAIPLVYALTLALAGPRAKRWALAAAWMTALWPFAVYCGFHTQGEMAGALFVLAGVAAPALLPAREQRAAYLLSGAAFGAALALKIDLAVAGLGFGVWQLVDRRWRRALWLVAGVAPLVVLVGAVDRLTWGSWFHSVLGHARVNLVEGVGNQWGVSPWYVHVLYFFDMVSVPALAAVAVVLPLFRNLGPHLKSTWFTNVFFVAVFALVPHKEKRFLAPVLYTAIATAFATLAAYQGRGPRLPRKWVRPAAALLALAFAAHFISGVVAYLVRRPWYDRIAAIRAAGEIPRIEKMLSPQWPAVFYLPRHVRSEAVEASAASLARATEGVQTIGVATDWSELSIFEEIGFRCEEWPNAGPGSAPHAEGRPRALKCHRK